MSRPRNLTEIKRHSWTAANNYWPVASMNPGGTVIFWDDNRVWMLEPGGRTKPLKADDLPDVVRQIIKEVVARRLACA